MWEQQQGPSYVGQRSFWTYLVGLTHTVILLPSLVHGSGTGYVDQERSPLSITL